MNKEEILKITKKFHDTYEKLSKEYDYETRKETRVFDINSSNGKLMYATVNEVIKPILEENQELKEKLDKYENPEDMTLFAMWCTEKVKDENQELKKQLEENKDKINWYENFEINKTIDKLRIKHNNQQKEFIEWLEAMSKMYENEYKDIDIAGHYNCVLAKYKEIIGGKE